MRHAIAIATAGLAALLAGCANAPPAAPPSTEMDEAIRTAALREAEAWHPVDTAALDPRVGPEGAIEPAAAIDCTFVVPHTAPGGNTPKFLCRDADGQIFKVKYGPDNMEVHSEIFGSRLLWMLGFYSDRIDPVRVRCRGCPEDPWDFLRSLDAADPRPGPPVTEVHEFAPAILETYFGSRIQAHAGQGLRWPELLSERSRDPARAAQQRIHREALTLLATFLGHGDSKPANQTLACAPGAGSPARCTRSVVYIGDLGALLGRGWRLVTSKVDIEDWESLPVWRDPAACVAAVNPHPIGTLSDTPISEPARAFLAERLSALSDRQLRSLFDLAGLDGLGGEVEDPDGTAHPPSLDDWLRVFDAKRHQIVDHTCPAG